jgi:hypothetical protein
MKGKTMRATTRVSGLAIASCLCFSGAAYAGFVNGGFEDGTFNGWTINQGFNNSDNEAQYYSSSAPKNPSPSADPLANVAWGWQNLYTGYGAAPSPTVISKGTTDGFVPSLGSMFIGNKMARLNDLYGGYHVTQISQTGQIDASDLGAGSSADLYINWAGVMDDPGHPTKDEPWFIIDVYKNSVLVGEERHYANDAGWVDMGANSITGDTTYASTGQFLLTGLGIGDNVTVTLTVADCGWGGHGAYAYLDGIGTAYVPPPPPPNGVPDCGATALLFAPALAGLGLLRRKVS